MPHPHTGYVLFLTGLSGSGKSTIADALEQRLLALGVPAVTMLDGDVVRTHLSSELGFSAEHRALNIRRIAFVAGEVARHGGVAICSPIAPFAQARKEARALVERHGRFVLIWVATPLEVCEARDPKGLYARARAGLIPQFTGVSDPYEPPDDAEIVIRTDGTPAEAVDQIVAHLRRDGLLR